MYISLVSAHQKHYFNLLEFTSLCILCNWQSPWWQYFMECNVSKPIKRTMMAMFPRNVSAWWVVAPWSQALEQLRLLLTFWIPRKLKLSQKQVPLASAKFDAALAGEDVAESVESMLLSAVAYAAGGRHDIKSSLNSCLPDCHNTFCIFIISSFYCFY